MTDECREKFNAYRRLLSAARRIRHGSPGVELPESYWTALDATSAAWREYTEARDRARAAA
jgi:hypothetical protein